MATLSFGGYLITADEKGVKIKPDPARIQELLDIKPPTNITELRSFLGSMKQLSKWLPKLSGKIIELNRLTLTKCHFLWTANHQEAFQKLKTCIEEELLDLKLFDVSLQSILYTDGSILFGLGYVLVQEDNEGNIEIIRILER